MVKIAKTGHGPHSPKLVICVVLLLFVLFYVLFVCKCILYHCHRVSTQLQLTNICHRCSVMDLITTITRSTREALLPSIITSSSSATGPTQLLMPSLLRLLPQQVVMLISSEGARSWIQGALTVSAVDEGKRGVNEWMTVDESDRNYRVNWAC